MRPAAALAAARRALAVSTGWIEPADGRYLVRLGRDRRARVVATLDEAAFLRLVESPGLRARPGGGWTARSGGDATSHPSAPGRPGLVEGRRMVIQPDGRCVARRANLTQTPVAWLARRRGPDGAPWLQPVHVAAALRLDTDLERALRGPHLTLPWDGVPRRGRSPVGSCVPGEAALAAARRVEAALGACGAARPMVERICVHASAMQTAERDLGLRRRSGKHLLRQGLEALARHYRLV